MNEIEFLASKGIKKTHQLNKRINLTMGELIEFLHEYSEIQVRRERELDNEQAISYYAN